MFFLPIHKNDVPVTWVADFPESVTTVRWVLGQVDTGDAGFPWSMEVYDKLMRSLLCVCVCVQ
jgi:hypothetical protein